MINSLKFTINNNRKCNISRQDISNWINKWNLPNIEYSSMKVTLIHYMLWLMKNIFMNK